MLAAARRSFSSSVWANVPLAPPDAILGLTVAFNADKDPRKVNLGAGTFKTEDNKPYVLSCVRKAEEALLSKKLDHEYLPISGHAEFNKRAAELAFGTESVNSLGKRLVSAQSISGTGALWMVANFLSRWFPGKDKPVLVPNPTWGNHKAVFAMAGLKTQDYRYWNQKTRGLDFEGLVTDLKKADRGHVVLLHACAHNPTGVDPTKEQWREIEHVVKEKGHFAFFDMAYQGFASGDHVQDAFAVRHFVENGHKIALTQSFAKNFGMYGERIGATQLICNDDKEAQAVDSQLKLVIRPGYSNPPIYGARVINHILSDPALMAEWHKELKFMSERMMRARKQLRTEIEKLDKVNNWSHITDQIGMFCFTGLSKPQVDALIKDHHIYLTQDGRISISGVNPNNVQYLAQAFTTVMKTVQ